MALTPEQITAKNFKEFYQHILPYLGGRSYTIGIGGGYAPIGTIISYMGTTAPQDYLICDGSVYSISGYKQLADFFTAQFGSVNFFGGDGTTTFAVPDLRGEFLRGTGTNGHTDQGDGANVGVHQNGTKFPDLYLNRVSSETTGSRLGIHKFPNAEVYASDTDKKTLYTASASESVKKEIALNQAYASSATTNAFTARPTNTSVLYCIKAVCAGEVYSTDERVVGTWIDGKPLYQKTITGTTPSNDGEVSTGITNGSNAVVVRGTFLNSAGYNANFAYADIGVDAKSDGSTIYFNYMNRTDFKNQPFTATIEYTKTTD